LCGWDKFEGGKLETGGAGAELLPPLFFFFSVCPGGFLSFPSFFFFSEVTDLEGRMKQGGEEIKVEKQVIGAVCTRGWSIIREQIN
jgi:hypothetical protein